jgi:hypothetical protein
LHAVCGLCLSCNKRENGLLEVYILLLHRLIWCKSVRMSVVCVEGCGMEGDSVRGFLDAGRKSWTLSCTAS